MNSVTILPPTMAELISSDIETSGSSSVTTISPSLENTADILSRYPLTTRSISNFLDSSAAQSTKASFIVALIGDTALGVYSSE